MQIAPPPNPLLQQGTDEEEFRVGIPGRPRLFKNHVRSENAVGNIALSTSRNQPFGDNHPRLGQKTVFGTVTVIEMVGAVGFEPTTR